MSGPDMASALVAALPTMRAFLAKFQRPFVATVSRTGKVSMLLTLAELVKRLR